MKGEFIMKRFICGFLAGALVFGTVGAFAASYIANPAGFKVLVNGKEFVSDPPALVVEGRTYLPLRAMGDVLGVPVNWNEELRQAEVGEEPKAANIDNVVKTNNKWKITYLNYKETPQKNEYTKAEEGKEFLFVFFEIENISNEQQIFSSIYSEYYVDDVSVLQYPLGMVDEYQPMVGGISVAPGKKTMGCIAIQVDPNWKTFEFIYNEDILKKDNDNVIKFLLNK